MEELNKLEVAKSSLQKARQYFTRKNWARAYAHYLTFLELRPNENHNIEKEFENVLYEFGESLEKSHKYQDLTKTYFRALRYFPSNVKILNFFGSHLLRFEQPELAIGYFQRAHLLDSDFLLAEKNFQSAKLSIIPRWHFRMLNDYKRNEAYRMAIIKSVTSQHNKVLDIGAGCGLLSFYAANSLQIESVVAVESSLSLSKIIIHALREFEVIKVVNKSSTELSHNEIGLSNLLVTEIFDAGLFGEHVLETLVHAWYNLLEPTAKVIPHHADVFVTGIQSEVIASRNNYLHKIPQLNLGNVCVRQFSREPYEAENLKEKSVKYLTDTVKAITVNFNNMQELKDLYTSTDAIPPCKIKCLQGGTIHAFAIWFDLHLDEDIMITTNPFKDNVTCWEQAIVYLDHPVTLQQDEEITLQLSCMDDRLEIQILDRPSTCTDCFEIHPEMITFLNDVQVAEAAEDLQLSDRYNQRPCQILDLNPVPLFALFRAKKGFAGNYQCVGIGDADTKFLDFMWRSNGFQPYNEAGNNPDITYKIIHWTEVYNKLGLRSLDVVFLNPISPNGILCETTFDNMPLLVAALKRDGLMLPREVTLQIELIDSKYLDFTQYVKDENLLGFRIADEINQFSVLEMWQVQPQFFQRKTLCNLTPVSNILANGYPKTSSSYDVNVPISGNANGVLYWYKMDFSENVCINTYKSVHYNGACFVFEPSRNVKSGDTLTINIQQDKGLLKIDCDDDEDDP